MISNNSLTDTELITVEVSAAPGRYYYLTDHLGSVRATVNENGDVVGYDDYYPFGLQMAKRSGVGDDRTREKFTGHELDGETGLLYAGARYYMSEIGRWMGVDPLADDFPGWSPYNYVLNNPLILIDPTGNCPEGVSGGEWFEDDTGNQVYCLASPDEITVTPGENGTTSRYIDTSTEEGRRAFYELLRINPELASSIISSNRFSLAAQQIAMRASIHSGQTSFLQNSAIMAGHGLSVASALTGVGVGALGVRMMLARGAGSSGVISSTLSYIGFAEVAAGRLALASFGAYAAGGDVENAAGALLGFGVGQAVVLSRAAYAMRGLREAPSIGPLYRSIATGRAVQNNVYGSRYGSRTVLGVTSGYFVGRAASQRN